MEEPIWRTILAILLSWPVVAVTLFFLMLMVALTSSKKIRMKGKGSPLKKRAALRATDSGTTASPSEKNTRKEPPGRILVPDSNYEALDKAGMIHHKENEPEYSDN